MLLVVPDGKVLDVEEVFGVGNERTLDVPIRIVDVDDRWHHDDIGRRLLVETGIEAGNCIKLTAHAFFGGLVVPSK